MEIKRETKGFYVMLGIILAGAILTMLNQSIINIALPHIMNDFSVDASTVQWIVTGYMLVTGIVVPISAFLVQRFTYRNLFLTAMSFFSIGSLVCALSSSFEVIMVGRMLQAVGGGIVLPLTMNIFIAAFPIEKRGSAMGLLGIGLILAPALGPTISGYVIANHTWNVLFYALAAFGILVVFIAFVFFRFKNEKGTKKLDVPGVMLSTIGFGALLYGVSNVSSKGWGSLHVYGFLIISVIALFLFVFSSLRKEDPLLEIRVFKDFNFSYTLIVNIILQITLYGGMILLPLYLQTIRGFTPLQAGILLLPGSAVMGLVGIFTGKLFDRYGIKPLAIIALTIMTTITFMFSKLSMTTPYLTIMILYTIRSFGMSFVLMPIASAGLVTVKKELIPHANAISSTLRQVAASVGVAILVVVMSDQMKKYMENLGEAVNAKSMEAGTLHGINVAFFVATCISAVALIMSLFFKKPKVV